MISPDFDLLAARNYTPESLTLLELSELERIFKELVDLEDPSTKRFYFPDVTYKKLVLLKENVMKEFTRRDSLPMVQPGKKAKDIKRIEWNGSQKQLAELFIELKQKGWIDEHNADTLKACFTKTDTIQQVLKPATDTRAGEDTYEQVYTKAYKPKFYGIKSLR